REHFAAVGACLAVALEDGSGQLLVFGIGGLLRGAFPGCTGALALLLHGSFEPGLVERNSSITTRILNKVPRQPVCIVKFECPIPRVREGAILIEGRRVWIYRNCR